MNRKQFVKKYLYLYMIALESLSITGCSNFSIQTTQVQEQNENQDNTNDFSSDDQERTVKDKKESKKTEKNKDLVKKETDDKYNKIKKEINSIDTNDIKKNLAKKFITFVEFISGNQPIHGIYFYELDDKAKKEITNLVKKLDQKIEKKYPNYKDPFIEKYHSLQTYIKENQIDTKFNDTKDQVIEKAKDTKDKIKDKTKDLIGEDNYQKIQTETEKAKTKIKKETEKGKQKVKDWYSNLKKKYQ